MDASGFGPEAGALWTGQVLVAGVPWRRAPKLIACAAELAATLGMHLVCAFVDPAGYLAEHEPVHSRMASSIDPSPDGEALFPAADVRASLETILGPPGESWSFRVLNGSVAEALARLANSAGAVAIVVGGPRRGAGPSLKRMLERPVSDRLVRIQRRPVIVVPGA